MDQGTGFMPQMSIIRPTNLYYILAYAFRIRPDGYAAIDSEKFENHLDVMASIIGHSMDSVIRKGLVRSYTPHSETTSRPHGKIDLRESIRTFSLPSNKVVCHFELYDHLTYENKIVASTIRNLISNPDLNKDVRANLRRTIRAMGDPGTVDIRTVDWSRIQTPRDRDFAMALNACRLIAECEIPKEDGEGKKVPRFLSQDKESRLYEEFVRGYFCVEHSRIYRSQRNMKWDIPEESSNDLIPSMEMDILLHSKNKALIIDTKCYDKSLAENMGHKAYHSPNIYQIKAYVHHWKYKNPSDITEGLLLYAYDGKEKFDQTTTLDGETFYFKSLDLNGEWVDIVEQLESVASLLSE